LEKEVDDLKNHLNETDAELDAALQANRNYGVELSKAKHVSEQISEQLEVSQKEKRRLAGTL
jgi:hypothetical protein